MLIKIPNLLSQAELDEISRLIETADWLPGSGSAGEHARARKHNEEMDQGCSSWAAINQRVVTRLYEHPEFQRCVLPSRVSAAYVSRCSQGMGYGEHVDDAVMGSTHSLYRADVAATVFLSNPENYEGGELAIRSQWGPVSVKLAAGSAVAYPASTRHQVTEVTSGERIVCVLWAQSLVRDTDQREILADLDDARRALRLSAPAAQVTEKVDHAYMNLLRLWSDP